MAWSEWSRKTVHKLFTSKKDLVNQGEHVSPVLLRFLLAREGLSNKQAADAIGINPETVRRGKIDEGGRGHHAFSWSLTTQILEAKHPGWMEDLARDPEAYDFVFEHSEMKTRLKLAQQNRRFALPQAVRPEPSLLDCGGLVN